VPESNRLLRLGSELENTMLQLSSSERAVPTDLVQAGTEVVRRRKRDPITIGMLAGGLILGTVGVAVAVSYSYAHSAGLAISMIWWGVYFGALGASIGALPGLFTQLDRARTRAKKNPPHVSGSRPRDSVN
jgi:hypothetical protein